MTLVGTGEYTIVDVNDGVSAYLTNNSSVLTADSAGVVSSYTSAETYFKILESGVDTTNNWSYYVSGTGGGISYKDSDDASNRSATGVADGGLGGNNLITNSATFQPIGGGPSYTTYLSDVVAPDGTTTGSRVVTIGSREFIEYTVANGTYVFSFYIKLQSGTSTLTLNLKDRGTDTIRGTTTISANTTWQRVQVTGTVAGASAGVRIELFGFAIGDVYWGAQLELGTSATEYSATSSTARSGTRGYVKIVDLTQDLSYLDITASKINGPSIVQRFSVAKSRQGVTGSTGTRGTITTSAAIAGTVWVDASADAAVASAGGGTPLQGDVVTLYNNAQSFSQTRIRSSGSTWTVLTALFGGNVIVDNTLSASKIVSNSITAGQISAGAIGATEIAANAITTSKLFVSGRGPAINDDQMFTDSTAWTAATGVTYVTNGALSTVTGAQGSTYVRNATGASNAWVTSRKYAINPAKTYRLTANLYAATGNDRNMYIFVRMYTADGVTELTGAQTGWGGSLAGYVYGNTPPVNQWSTQGALFGANTTLTIPSNAAYMQVGVWFQYSVGTSSVEQACQNLYITEAVDNSLIVDGTIYGTKIVADSITSTQIAANAITASEIAASAINATHIQAGAIEAGKIAAGSIQALDIAAGAITGDKIAANTITATQIAANSITAGQIAAATITGDKIAANTIGANNILANSITSAQIAAGTITAGQIAAGTITAGQIAAGTITAGQIAAGAIGAAQIAAGAIRTDKLFVTGQGKALNDDPACMDLSAWSYDAGTISILTDSTSPSGTTVIAATDATHFYSRNFPIEAGKTYKVSAFAKQISGTGTMYLRLFALNSVGTLVSYQVIGLVPITSAFEGVVVPGSWTRYTGTATPAAGAVTGYVSVNANWSTTGSAYFTDIRVEEQISADLIVDGTISAAKMVTGVLSADNVLTRGLTVRDNSGNIILSAGNPLSYTNVAASTDWLNGNITINSSGQITGIGTGVNTTVSNSLLETLSFVYPNNGTLFVSGNTISKTGGTSSWTESGVRSTQSYVGGAVLTFSPNYSPSLARQCAIGLNTDPDADYNYTSIDYAFNLVGGTPSNIRIMESGTVIDLATAWVASDVFTIQYDGMVVKYMINGVTVRIVNANINVPIYLDSSFNGVGSSISKITFAALTKTNEFSVNRIYTFDTGVDGFGEPSNVSLTASGGSLIVTGTAVTDPNFKTPVFGTSLVDGALDGSKYNIIRMKIKRTQGTSNDFQVFFASTTHGETEPNSIHVYPSLVNNVWSVVDIDMSSAGDWSSAIVTKVRFDLGNDANTNWAIDYIAFGRISPQIPTDLLYVGSAVVGTKISSVDGKFVVDFNNKYISITI